MKEKPHGIRRRISLCAVTTALLLSACTGGNGRHRVEPSILGGADSIDPRSSGQRGTPELRETSDTNRIEKALNEGSKLLADDVYITPDGRHLITEYRQSDGGGDEQIVIWDMDTMRIIYSNTIGPNLAFAIANDGTLLAFAQPDGTTMLVNLKLPQSQPTQLNTPCTEYVEKIVFSSDNRHLMLSCDQVAIWDIVTGEYRIINTNVRLKKNAPSFSIGVGSGNDIGFAADGTTVVAATIGGGVGKLSIGKQKLSFAPCHGCGDENTNVFISPDGKTVRFIAETAAWIWDVNSEQETTHLASRQYLNYGALVKLQDGRWISFGFDQSKKSTTMDSMEIFSPDGRSSSIASVNSIFRGKAVNRAVLDPNGLLIAVAGEDNGDPGSFRVLRMS